MNPFSLEGKTILITGASSGIGRQCAISCSQMGAKVIALGRDIIRLTETLDMMDKSNEHMLYSYDLSDISGIEDLIKDIVNENGKLNGLVHCAGVSMVFPFKNCGQDKIESIFNVNVFSAIALSREAIKVGRFSKEGGSIIFIASVMGCVGASAKSLYSMSKGALIAGSRSLAVELATKKIRVNCISPGVIVTPINANLPHIADPEQRLNTESQHLLGLGEAEDVANAAIYLLSDASKWVTGTNLIVDGGYTAK